VPPAARPPPGSPPGPARKARRNPPAPNAPIVGKVLETAAGVEATTAAAAAVVGAAAAAGVVGVATIEVAAGGGAAEVVAVGAGVDDPKPSGDQAERGASSDSETETNTSSSHCVEYTVELHRACELTLVTRSPRRKFSAIDPDANAVPGEPRRVQKANSYR